MPLKAFGGRRLAITRVSRVDKCQGRQSRVIILAHHRLRLNIHSHGLGIQLRKGQFCCAGNKDSDLTALSLFHTWLEALQAIKCQFGG